MSRQLRLNESLAPYTSWRVGGPAERYFRPLSSEDLAIFLQSLPSDEPVWCLGLGSNVLIRDGGIAGTVIHLLPQGGINRLEWLPEKRLIRAEAGVSCAKLARFCAQNNLQGGEFFAGIPGTVGGALAMNAGAFGQETWQYVHAVEVVTRKGEQLRRLAEAYRPSYRRVEKPEAEWFMAADFAFPPQRESGPEASIAELLRKRNLSQPIGEYSCGSVFKNPAGDFAGRLIEAAQLKGLRLGGARVSPKHANFIVNEQQATASEIEELIYLIKDKVLACHGVELQLEVQVLGISG